MGRGTMDGGTLTKRENAMAILNGKQPDFYGNFMEAMVIIPDPVWESGRTPNDGRIHKDNWGSEFIFPPDSAGRHPVGKPEGLVIKDIERWKEQLTVPSLEGFDWSKARKLADAVDRKKSFCAAFCTPGMFKRSHHLMSLEEGLINYLSYEDEVACLLRAIADYMIQFLHLVAQELHVDAVFYQDDWGTKTNLWLPPDLWRRLIKPLHTEIVAAAHEHGILFVHHADCVCEPIVQDMIDTGIDVWQGVIPQNDIVKIQRETNGKLPMIGGIDGPAIDSESTTEEEIRAEVRRAIDTYCPGGRFFPAIAYGKLFVKKNQAILEDEMEKYGRQWAMEHPIQ